MRAARLAITGFAAAVLVLAGGGAAAAQTTTVPPIPVTGGRTASTTTTTAPASAGTSATSSGLADTGVAADLLVPFGFALIGTGAVMQAVARRRSRTAYGLL